MFSNQGVTMKKFFMMSLAITGLLGAINGYAQENYELKKLDVIQTCRTANQVRNAEMALDFMKAQIWWNIKDQYEALHPEQKGWHGSLAGTIAANPASNAQVPFKDGVITKDNMVKTFALIAFLNDIRKYRVAALRLDCVDENTIIIVGDFTSVQIRRDEKGCVTHELPYGTAINLQFEYRDYKADANSANQRLLYRTYTHMDYRPGLKVKADLARLAQGPANVEMDPANCKTYPQLIQEFQEQLEE